MENTEPAEVALGRATVNLTQPLDREMDALFKDLLEEVINAAPSLQQKRAVAANRIVLICRCLADELRRYEHVRWLCDHTDSQDHDPEGDIF